MNEEQEKFAGELHEDVCTLIDKYKDSMPIHTIISGIMLTLIGGFREMPKNELKKAFYELVDLIILTIQREDKENDA